VIRNNMSKICPVVLFPALMVVSVCAAWSAASGVLLSCSGPASPGAALDVEVTAVDGQDQPDIFLDGERNFRFMAGESGSVNNSTQSQTKSLLFTRGRAHLLISDSEAEKVDLEVTVDGFPLAGRITLDFARQDIDGPQVSDVKSDKGGIITIKFNEPLDEESALDKDNYRLITDKREISPDNIEYHKDYLVLKFDSEFEDQEEGSVEMTSIKDLSGNEISSGTRTSSFICDCGCDD